MSKFSPVAKALVAAVVTVVGAALIAVQAAVSDGTVTSQEWVTILIAVLTAIVTTGGVYAKANAPAPPAGQ